MKGMLNSNMNFIGNRKTNIKEINNPNNNNSNLIKNNNIQYIPNNQIESFKNVKMNFKLKNGISVNEFNERINERRQENTYTGQWASFMKKGPSGGCGCGGGPKTLN